MGPLKIYISHRHDDKKIADSLRQVLQGWGNGQLKIAQSSDVRENGNSIGMELSYDQKAVLSDNSIVILIYTVVDNDWYYCMWESGIANNNNGHGTRTLLFHCAGDLPESLLQEPNITLEEDSIKQFSQDFHKNSSFFPGLQMPFASNIDDETLNNRSHELFYQMHGICNV
jgi:hypothetical protein